MERINIQKLVDAGLVKLPTPMAKTIFNPIKRAYNRKSKYNKNSKAPMNLKAAELYLSQKTLAEFGEEHGVSLQKLKRAAYDGEVLESRIMAIVALFKAQEPLASICTRLGANFHSTQTLLWVLRKDRKSLQKAA
jgi:hypothetical protein